MEVGAVKQAFNNEVIQLKRNLNQAKLQTIHKLTRKAKTFTEKKTAPEKLKEKLKRKAESAVSEVLILKKVKPKDIAKFAVTHTGNLQDYLNKPKVDHDKACARLLLHKSLQAKYNYIRNTFSNISINDLLMSRHERRKMKKEAQEKQKMKKDKKQKVVNAEGDWEVENLKRIKSNDAKVSGDELSVDDEDMESNREDKSEKEDAQTDDEESNGEERSETDIEEQNEKESDADFEAKEESDQEMDSDDDLPDGQSDGDDDDADVGKFVRPGPVNIVNEPKSNKKIKNKDKLSKIKTKQEFLKPPKPKDVNKNKNLKEKLISRKFKKDSSELEVRGTKVVDPFFITSTGENYMSVAEPRQPDEVKEIHKQGNRKLRRAAMFGHVPKIKPRSDNSYNYNRQNDSEGGFRNKSMPGDGHYKNNYDRNNSQFKDRNDSRFKGRNDSQFTGRNNSQFKGRNDNQFKGRNDFKNNDRSNPTTEPKEEKLHPSWEAKKKKSGILPFQGKKTVFDES